jgi:hypothetical protein
MTRYRQLLARFRKNPIDGFRTMKHYIGGDPLIVVVASAHKVGSTWLYMMLRDLNFFDDKDLSFPDHLMETGTILLSHESYNYLSKQQGVYLYKSHSYPQQETQPRWLRLITVIRDPRDVLVSASFYLANLPEQSGGWGREFAGLSVKDRISELICHGDFILDRLEQWYRYPDAIMSRYEVLKDDPASELRRICTQIGIPTSENCIQMVVEKNRFENMSGRNTGEEDVESFYRKGIVGDWKVYFDKELKKQFKKERDGRWHSLLFEMGYGNSLE